MRKQDYLLQLMCSLSPNEKRYFKLLNVQPGEKRYVDLFDALEGKDQYNASELSKQLDIPLNKLGDDKSYLTKALLRSLVHYDEDVTETNAVFHNYLECFALFERRMFGHSLEICEKTLIKAWNLEMFNLVPLLLASKSACLYSLSRFDELETIQVDYDRATAAGSEVSQITILRARATDLEMRRQGEDEFEELVQHPLLQLKVEQLKSLRAQIAWFDIMQRYSLLMGKHDHMLQLAKAEVAHYAKNPQIKVITPVGYVVAHTRVADSESSVGNIPAALEAMKKVVEILDSRKLELSPARVKSLKFYADLAIGEYLYQLGDYKKSITTFERRQKQLPERPVYEQYSFQFFLAMSYMHSGRSNDALDKVNELLQMKTTARMDLQPYVRVLMIMLQINLGNEEMITFLVRTTKAWLKRNHLDNDEMATFLKLIYPLPNTPIFKRQKVWDSLNAAIADGSLKEMNETLQLNKWVANISA